MKVMLLTSDPERSGRFREASKNTERIRLVTVRNAGQMLEQLFREPFDALIADEPCVTHPHIRKCPVLWPNQMYLLLHEPMLSCPVPASITYCFSDAVEPKRVFSMIESLPGGQIRRNDTECRISHFLQQMSVPVSLGGFDYLREAIRLMLMREHLTDVQSLNALYDVLAGMTGVSAPMTEHAIRHAIDAAWMLAEPEELEKLFGDTVDSERAAPSNAAYLFRAADHIRMHREEDNNTMTMEEMQEMEDALRSVYHDYDALLNGTINAVMHALCVPAKLLGYRYIFLAVRFIRTRPPKLRSTTKKELYPYIEQCMNTTKPMIMRTMHYAIEQAWERADPDVLYSYLGLRGKNRKDPPSNLEFVYLIAERVRLIIGDPLWEEHYQRVLKEIRKKYPWLN